MRRALVILVIGLAVLLFPTPAFSNTHKEADGRHVHFVPSSASPGATVEIQGRMWSGAYKVCKNVSGVKVSADGITGDEQTVTTDKYKFFYDTWKMGKTSGSMLVRVRCYPNGNLYLGRFKINPSGTLADNGTPALLTLGVGMTLITAGWLMLMVARSDRLKPAIVIPGGVKGKFVGTAGGSDTAATPRQ